MTFDVDNMWALFAHTEGAQADVARQACREIERLDSISVMKQCRIEVLEKELERCVKLLRDVDFYYGGDTHSGISKRVRGISKRVRAAIDDNDLRSAAEDMAADAERDELDRKSIAAEGEP